MEIQQITFLIIMAVSIYLFVTDYLRVDVVAILIILALSLTGLIDAKAAFSGFSSEPALIVCAVFVLSAGLSLTGVTDVIGSWVGKLAGASEARANVVIMSAVAVLSAFTHHLMVTAMMLPIVMKICKEKGFHSSRLLIPMATSASLGTTLTLIGAPAFLLANNILVRSGEPSLGLFSVAKVGGPLVVVGLFFILIMTWILPKRSGESESDERFKLSEISTELVVPEGSHWIDKTFSQLEADTGKRFEIFSWYRDGNLISRDADREMKQGDLFLVKIGSDELVSVEEKMGLALHAVKKFGAGVPDSSNTTLADEEKHIFQAFIAPRSPFAGKTLSQLRFYHRHGVVAVGIWRKSGWLHEAISNIPLQEGDLVVLWGPEANLEKLTEHRGFLMFLPFHGKSKKRIKMPLSVGIMGLSILAAAAGWVDAYVAFTCGAIAMVIFKCVSTDQAYSSIETKIFVMIAGVIPLGIAMEKSGVAQLSADFLLKLTAGWEPFAMLMVFFWFSGLLTQILSDAATTVLLGPIALAFAKAASISPTAAVVTVTMGAVASFLTPIGHHGNLLILGAGGYKFVDFIKIGLPLTIILSFLTCYLSLLAWG